MKKWISLFSFLLAMLPVVAQDFVGTWKGDLEVMGQKLPLVFNIDKKDSGYTSTIDSPMQGAMGIPVDKTTVSNNEITLVQTAMNAEFKGKIIDGKLSGNFVQNGFSIPLVLSKTSKESVQLNRPQTPKPPFDYATEEVSFINPKEGNRLAGTLVLPKNMTNTTPIVVMITGSGAQNRNEEILGHQPFWVLADYLANKGVASLRLDDRGVGESEKGKDDATSLDFATDISSAVDFLSKKGYKNIGLLGHSEGGMIAPMVAVDNKNVKFLVLLAAPGVPISELMVQQNEEIGKLAGLPEQLLAENRKTNTEIYNFIINYKENNLSQELTTFIKNKLKESAHGQLTEEQLTNQAEEQAKVLSSPWYVYFLKFVPANYLSQVKVPTLVLNGSLDRQVTAKENLAGIKKSFEKAKNKNIEIKEMAGLNHLFQTATTGNPSEYGQIEETLSPKVLEIISQWIGRLK